jgi:hypothetical protein
MLAAAAATAVLVYVVRRHRTDDYRGGYRIWLWAAAWMMVMSADAVARLRDAWRAAAVAQFGWTGPGNGIVWWAVPCALAAATIGVRLFLDMRDSRASTAWLCLAGPTWSLGEVFMAIRPAFGDALPFDLIAAGCSFAGQWCLFVAMSWHARHVVLDASGGLRVRKKKKSRRNAAATEQSSATSRSATGSADQSKSRPAPSTTSAVVAKSPVAKTNAAAAESTLATKLTFGGRAANETSRDGGHLSKAERKKLKRDMRRAA